MKLSQLSVFRTLPIIPKLIVGSLILFLTAFAGHRLLQIHYANVAISEAEHWDIVSAMKHLSNRTLLLKVAFESPSYHARNVAFEKLDDMFSADQRQAINNFWDPLHGFLSSTNLVIRQQASCIFHLRKAFTEAGVPGYKRARLGSSFLILMKELINPLIVRELGSIESITIGRRKMTQSYALALPGGGQSSGVTQIEGEDIGLTVKFEKRDLPVSSQWGTQFAPTAHVPTEQEADITDEIFFSAICAILPRKLLEQLASQDGANGLTRAAVKRLKVL